MIEMWGGLECTINRIGDIHHDQLQRNGHRERLSDLEKFASLGIKALRYPALWESIELQPNSFSWGSVEERLHILRDLGIRVVATLLHHGSGPLWTNLLDPAFPKLFARFAHAFASRFPWIEHYTPINEPLTTARFSALYGHWHPHARDNALFAKALLNECRASILAMREIRSVCPEAKCIQTEDIGKTHATTHLQYQADFENERRWLSLDLLCGKLTKKHSMWTWLADLGISEYELSSFQETHCTPSIIGINYYVTSERWIDHNLERYPQETHGGNNIHRYADVEAIRVPEAETALWDGILEEHIIVIRYLSP